MSEDAGELKPPFQVPSQFDYEYDCDLEKPIFRVKKYATTKKPKKRLDAATRLEA